MRCSRAAATRSRRSSLRATNSSTRRRRKRNAGRAPAAPRTMRHPESGRVKRLDRTRSWPQPNELERYEMAEIAASTVMELRQRTGLGMMECKKALTEAGGDLAKAEELLRIRSGAKASKAAGRVAAEGVIGLAVTPDAKV